MTTLFKNGDAGGINHCESTLASGLAIGATSATLAAGTGNRFPVVVAPDVAYVTIQNATYYEIVKITAHALGSDTLTIERAQEGTNDRAWLTGDVVSMRLTAAQAESAVNAQAVAQAALVAHEAAANPHPDYTTTAELAAGLETKQGVDATLTALAALDGTAGLLEQTGLDAFTRRSVASVLGISRCEYDATNGVTMPRGYTTGADFNFILNTGIYNLDANLSANRPSAASGWVFLEVFRHVNFANEYIVQVCHEMNAVAEARTWVRKYRPGAWSAWVEITPYSTFGFGQTWQSPGYALGTTYTNSDGKPRFIRVQVSGTSGGAGTGNSAGISIDGGAALTLVSPVTGYGTEVGEFIVPAGSTYRVYATGGSLTLNAWHELRN